jgi:hypothetical protein
MRGTGLLAILLALGVGCASTVDVVYDERQDFSSYRTWDWLPQDLPSIDAPHSNADALDARLMRLIERELVASGFPRAGAGPPDFFVTYHLALRRRSVLIDEPAAPYLLSSLHSSPSYWIEGSRKAKRVYEDVRLAIGMSEGRGRMIWRALLQRTLEDPSLLPLDADVATLLARIPRTPPADARTRSASGH